MHSHTLGGYREQATRTNRNGSNGKAGCGLLHARRQRGTWTGEQCQRQGDYASKECPCVRTEGTGRKPVTATLAGRTKGRLNTHREEKTSHKAEPMRP
ncbi:hypothetical protein R1flu_028595 [Riccia fluitans]|uniref:Uncharacterized protein n=1 Tax=Riccia fluitans TaxID=41844 RepID=A0ABD1XM54_9MARC